MKHRRRIVAQHATEVLGDHDVRIFPLLGLSEAQSAMSTRLPALSHVFVASEAPKRTSLRSRRLGQAGLASLHFTMATALFRIKND